MYIVKENQSLILMLVLAAATTTNNITFPLFLSPTVDLTEFGKMLQNYSESV